MRLFPFLALDRKVLVGAVMEETNELRAKAMINVVTLLLLSQNCITNGEAEAILDLTLGDDPLITKGLMLTVKGLRNLIMGLENRALSCDERVALAAGKLLREALKELNGSIESNS
jgi:hypothetical protein